VDGMRLIRNCKILKGERENMKKEIRLSTYGI
jgi:hypothetical protein